VIHPPAGADGSFFKSTLPMRLLFRSAIIFTVCCLSGCSGDKTPATGEAAAKVLFNSQMDSLINALQQLDSLVKQGSPVPVLQKSFAESRRLYKYSEGITEYYFQGLTRRINGPALPDVKTEDGQVWPPHGFQVIEQYLFSPYDDSLKDHIVE
jgi:cytochrome c peroxidase